MNEADQNTQQSKLENPDGIEIPIQNAPYDNGTPIPQGYQNLNQFSQQQRFI
jgi:hypothetical protein